MSFRVFDRRRVAAGVDVSEQLNRNIARLRAAVGDSEAERFLLRVGLIQFPFALWDPAGLDRRTDAALERLSR